MRRCQSRLRDRATGRLASRHLHPRKRLRCRSRAGARSSTTTSCLDASFLQLAGAIRSRRGFRAWAPCLTPSLEPNLRARHVNTAARHRLFPSQILLLKAAFTQRRRCCHDGCPVPGCSGERAADRRGVRSRYHRLDGRRDRCGEGEDRRHRAQRLRRATATRRALRNRRLPRSRRRLRDQGVSLLARNRGRAENAAEPRRGRWRRRARIGGRRPVRRRARAAVGFLEEHRTADLPRGGCRPASLFSVLNEGGKTWVADRELSESEWKKGAAALAKDGKVHVAASPPAVPADAVPMNNLDAEIASTVRAKAESLGVSY